MIFVREWTLPLGVIVVEVVVEGLAKQVLKSRFSHVLLNEPLRNYQTMQMMQSFHIGREASPVFLVDFDLVRQETGSLCLIGGDD